MTVFVALRLFSIALGAFVLLGLQWGYLSVEFKPVTEGSLNALYEIVGITVGLPLWEMLFDWLRQHFMWLPAPEPHWKAVFTLSALLMLSMARASHWYMIPCGLACSLVAAYFAGTLPLDSRAIFFAPLLGFITFLVIFSMLHRNWQSFVFFTAIGLLTSFTFDFGTRREPIDQILFLATFVGLWGFQLVQQIMFQNEGTLMQRLQHPLVVSGIDILATLGLALALGYLFAA